MELSQRTISILKNFSTINNSLWIKPGSELRSMTEAKTCLASAEVEEEFDREFGIYNLGQFLSVLSMFDSPYLEFQDTHVLIRDQERRMRTRYFYAAKTLVTQPSEKDLSHHFDSDESPKLNVSATDLKNVMRFASTLRTPEIAFRSPAGSGRVEMIATDIRSETANDYSVTLLDGINVETAVDHVFRVSNMLMLEMDYEVALASSNDLRLAQFTGSSEGLPVRYWIAAVAAS